MVTGVLAAVLVVGRVVEGPYVAAPPATATTAADPAGATRVLEDLEDALADFAGSVLVVSHDRYFLDRVCTDILELEGGELHHYPGNYQDYLREKEAREQIASTTAKKTRSLYKQELEWMRRQPKARTTKSKSRIEDFEEIPLIPHLTSPNILFWLTILCVVTR